MGALKAEDASITTQLLDVGERDAVMATFKRIEADHERIDGLVCGAAIQPRTRADILSSAEWQRVIDINLNGVVWCYQAAIKGMIARRDGTIIAFSSGLAHQAGRRRSPMPRLKVRLLLLLRAWPRKLRAIACALT